MSRLFPKDPFGMGRTFGAYGWMASTPIVVNGHLMTFIGWQNVSGSSDSNIYGSFGDPRQSCPKLGR